MKEMWKNRGDSGGFCEETGRNGCPLRDRRGTEGDGGGRIEGEWRRREEGQREDVPGL